MGNPSRTKVLIIVSSCVALFAALFFLLRDDEVDEYQIIAQELPVHYNGEKFAGSESCIPCHESIYRTHLETAHHNTSHLATDDHLLGSFNADEDKLILIGSSLQMLEKSDGFYQRIIDYSQKKTSDSKIDLVIGSGVKGQSHLSFEGDSLYQLQASYLSLTDGWINSPGFPNYPFKRTVMDNCIKCHVTFAKNKDATGNSNTYFEKSFLLGVECERCHGPSQDHVDFQNGSTAGKSDPMLSLKTLDRELRIDACAQCHGGLRGNQVKENPFSYVVGEKLDDFSKNFSTGVLQAKLDVHGNQVGLLKSSECFKNSDTMNCATCHDSHKDQRGEAQVFNSKCMECHINPETLHSEVLELNSLDFQNCIECHMPLVPSNTMKVKLPTEQQESSVTIRTHLIGIYIDSILQ